MDDFINLCEPMLRAFFPRPPMCHLKPHHAVGGYVAPTVTAAAAGEHQRVELAIFVDTQFKIGSGRCLNNQPPILA